MQFSNFNSIEEENHPQSNRLKSYMEFLQSSLNNNSNTGEMGNEDVKFGIAIFIF